MVKIGRTEDVDLIFPELAPSHIVFTNENQRLNTPEGTTITPSELEELKSGGVTSLHNHEESGGGGGGAGLENYHITRLRVFNGTQENTIKVMVTGKFNSPFIDRADDLYKGGSIPGFSLTANGYSIILEPAAVVADNILAVVAVLYENGTGIDNIYPRVWMQWIETANKIVVSMRDNSNIRQDWTSLVDNGAGVGEIAINLIYITDV